MIKRPKMRCKKCGKLLAVGRVVWVEIKCPRCGYMNKLEAA